MGTIRLLGLVVALAVTTTSVGAQGSPGVESPWKTRLSAGAFVGYQSGPGGQLFVTASDFAEGFPFMLRLRAGWTSVEPGEPGEARRIFINDATNGTPRERGRVLDLGLDGIYGRSSRLQLYGGVRHARFLANFNFIGGNEDFDVTSAQWGLAAGLEARYPMGARAALLLSGGAEYFFPSRLSGHDTSYSPDGDDVNPRKEYTFDDAAGAVEQPEWRPVVLLGVSYRLGGR